MMVTYIRYVPYFLVNQEWAAMDPEQPVFIEDEGPNVGKVSVPPGLYRYTAFAPSSPGFPFHPAAWTGECATLPSF